MVFVFYPRSNCPFIVLPWVVLQLLPEHRGGDGGRDVRDPRFWGGQKVILMQFWRILCNQCKSFQGVHHHHQLLWHGADEGRQREAVSDLRQTCTRWTQGSCQGWRLWSSGETICNIGWMFSNIEKICGRMGVYLAILGGHLATLGRIFGNIMGNIWQYYGGYLARHSTTKIN